VCSSRTALAWSGGKDSALALLALREEHSVEPCALITTVTESFDRVSMHGVRRELLVRQAEAIGVPVVDIPIPPGCTNDLYEARMRAALGSPALHAVAEVAFGDLFLADVRAYREERLAAAGRRALFPLWGRDTAGLARQFLDRGFETVVVCVDPSVLDASFAGRAYDASFLADLPEDVDPCGENGEFHTFVYGGPIFSTRLPCRTGEIVARDGFVFCDILPLQ
jgi:uncharacterized protein (TIGR00290 family)